MTLEDRVRASGLLDAPVVVLLSGGRDSVALLDLAVTIVPRGGADVPDGGARPSVRGAGTPDVGGGARPSVRGAGTPDGGASVPDGGARPSVRGAGTPDGAARNGAPDPRRDAAPPVVALHVNYGLRDAADADEAHCRALCERLNVPLTVHRAGAPRGNVQNWARDERYAAAAAFGRDVAVGHTASDQVETVLYRLAASPGRRALLGMRPRRDRIVRPLLGVSRAETAAHCSARGLPWVEDASNASLAYARNRARANLVPALRELHPAAEANVLRTLEILRDEAEVLDEIVAGIRNGRAAMPAAELAALAPALRRLVFPELGDRTDEALALAAKGGTRYLDVPGHRVTIARGAISVASRP